MIRLDRRAAGDATGSDACVTLTREQRERSRQRVALDDGREAGIFLERGSLLRDGDRLASEDGTVVLVRARPEPVSTVEGAGALALVRAAYHLGNRHVALQIGPGWLRYPSDAVLDEMVRRLGLSVSPGLAPFDPEPGAYGGPGHHHGHHHD